MNDSSHSLVSGSFFDCSWIPVKIGREHLMDLTLQKTSHGIADIDTKSYSISACLWQSSFTTRLCSTPYFVTVDDDKIVVERPAISIPWHGSFDKEYQERLVAEVQPRNRALREDIIVHAICALQNAVFAEKLLLSRKAVFAIPKLVEQVAGQGEEPLFLLFRTGTLPIPSDAIHVKEHDLFREYHHQKHTYIEMKLETVQCWNPDTVLATNTVVCWSKDPTLAFCGYVGSISSATTTPPSDGIIRFEAEMQYRMHVACPVTLVELD